jgi:hypothetical protein
MTHPEKPVTGLNLRIPLTALALFLGATLVLAAAQMPTAKSLTVGEFTMLAAGRTHQDDTSQAPPTPEAAVASLQRGGIRIRPNLSSPLTEGDAVEIFGQFGIVLQTEHHESLLAPERAASLLGIFGGTLASAEVRFGVSSASRATSSALGVQTVETTPYDCQTLPRPPSPCVGPQSVCNPCMDCCKVTLGLTGKVCGALCQKKNLIVSPSEPTP